MIKYNHTVTTKLESKLWTFIQPQKNSFIAFPKQRKTFSFHRVLVSRVFKLLK